MMGRFIVWFLIGIAATFVVVAANSDANTAVFVFLCPLGAVIWVPVGVAFGLIGMLLGAIFGSGKPKDRPLSDHAKIELRNRIAKAQAASTKNAALKDYLGIGTDRGLSPEYMITVLTRNGWKEAEIRKTLEELAST